MISSLWGKINAKYKKETLNLFEKKKEKKSYLYLLKYKLRIKCMSCLFRYIMNLYVSMEPLSLTCLVSGCF